MSRRRRQALNAASPVPVGLVATCVPFVFAIHIQSPEVRHSPSCCRQLVIRQQARGLQRQLSQACVVALERAVVNAAVACVADTTAAFAVTYSVDTTADDTTAVAAVAYGDDSTTDTAVACGTGTTADGCIRSCAAAQQLQLQLRFAFLWANAQVQAGEACQPADGGLTAKACTMVAARVIHAEKYLPNSQVCLTSRNTLTNAAEECWMPSAKQQSGSG